MPTTSTYGTSGSRGIRHGGSPVPVRSKQQWSVGPLLDSLQLRSIKCTRSGSVRCGAAGWQLSSNGREKLDCDYDCRDQEEDRYASPHQRGSKLLIFER